MSKGTIHEQLFLPTLMAIIKATPGELTQVGLQPENLAELRRLNMADLEGDAARYADSLLQISINPNTFGTYIKHRVSERAYVEQIDRAIECGINYIQLQALSGISREEFKQRQASLCVPAIPRGRIPTLTEAEETSLHKSWKYWRQILLRSDTGINESLNSHQILSLLERCSKDTGVRIDRLYQAVMEMEKIDTNGATTE